MPRNILFQSEWFRMNHPGTLQITWAQSLWLSAPSPKTLYLPYSLYNVEINHG